MKKASTPSFILELPLRTTTSDESFILKQLNTGRQVYNACVGELIKRLDLMKQSKDYQRAVKIPKGKLGSVNQKTRTLAFAELNKRFKFTPYDISEYATDQIRDSWIGDHVNSRLTQTISARAFKTVQKKAFRIAKRVRFKGRNQFDSMEGNDNKTGLIFRDGILNFKELKIPCIIDEHDEYQKYGLKHRVKYCRIVRRKFGLKNRFYVQLILEGLSYKNPDNIIGTEEVGLDIGPSTIAYVGDTTAELKEFCPELKPDWRKKCRLQRKMDRSKRTMNPDNYNENGTIKKGRKGRKFWQQSNIYKRTRNALANHERKVAAHRNSLHGKLANEIIAVGVKIKTEKISYKAWQKMYGKSILMKAPSMIVNKIQRKAENAHGYLHEIPTYSTKLSQTCHICTVQVKKPLNQRWHRCCDIEIQRDLYSAYLAKCVDKTTDVLDIIKANKLWSSLEPVLNNAISRTEARVAEQLAANKSVNGRTHVPSSFGLAQRQSRSHIKPEKTTTKAIDDVIQNADESYREVVSKSGTPCLKTGEGSVE